MKFPAGSTLLVHIGKSGGQTLSLGINKALKNRDVQIVHTRKPIYRKDLNYIILARNPLSRLESAFRWRYKILVTDCMQQKRFKGEYAVLIKYRNLNKLAEALYHEDGTANITAQQDIRKIHHIREDISFYLNDLLNRCEPSQIIAVLMQESLDDDILRVFGYKNELRVHRSLPIKEESVLSETALKNIMKFFAKDYEALIKLYCWEKIEWETFVQVIK